jgi:hypothetical protein
VRSKLQLRQSVHALGETPKISVGAAAQEVLAYADPIEPSGLGFTGDKMAGVTATLTGVDARGAAGGNVGREHGECAETAGRCDAGGDVSHGQQHTR